MFSHRWPRITGCISLLSLVTATTSVHAQGGREFRFRYAAKVACGTPTPTREVKTATGVVQQSYATTINIHNPSDSMAFFVKSLVVTLPPGMQRPVKPGRPFTDSLPPNYALATDCTDMRRRWDVGLPFFEGFVLIESRMSLDVVGLYTVPGGIDVVNVPERIRER
jgi:hypothetical protein